MMRAAGLRCRRGRPDVVQLRSVRAFSAAAAPTATSWVPLDERAHFPLQNLPYGVVSAGTDSPRACVRIGDHVRIPVLRRSNTCILVCCTGLTRGVCMCVCAHVRASSQALDLSVLAEHGLFTGFDSTCFAEGSLNTFMGLGRPAWDETRAVVTRLLNAEEAELRDNATLKEQALLPLEGLQVHMPAKIGDYTDFYSSREHATNVGIMFRGADNALQPSWLHLPVGYHGRASSIVVSGTDVRRPAGQVQPDPEQPPIHAPTKMLDFELEMAFFVGPGTDMGEPISMANADDHIFGMCLMNDWSARDIQKWEYVPLGPFGAKNFATTISPWVVPMAALEPFRCATSAKEQVDPAPLPYLVDPSYGSYDIKLEVTLQSEQMQEPHVISRSNFRHLYWSIRQQLVHHSVTGCNMNPGDLLGSGTISGDHEGSYGSMLELAWMGTKPLELPTGEQRASIQDGDILGMDAVCTREDLPFKVGFGKCDGRIIPH